MTTRSGSCFLLFALMTTGLWAAAPVATTRSDKSILLTVLDRGDGPVTGLRAADIAVFEDGVRREVSSVVPATQPLFVSVLIDNARPASGNSEPVRDMRTSLITFVRTIHAASPSAQIALTGVGGAGLSMRNFTDNTADLEHTLGRLIADPRATSVMMEAMLDAARELAKKPGPRRVIVTVDMASKESSQVQPSRVVEEVRKSGAAVWSVSIQSLESVTSPARDTTLNYLTEHTGGTRATAVVPSAMEMMLERLARSLTTQYEVTYERPDGPTPKAVTVTGTTGTKFLVAPWIQ